MGRARDISKVFSTSTSLATDSEVSGLYLTQASASTTYQTKATNGLTLINTTSFSSVNSVSVPNNTFTATYDNYFVLYKANFSTAANCTIRLRASGSDLTSALYRYAAHHVSTNSDHLLTTGNTQTSGQIVTTNLTRHTGQLTFTAPYLSQNTQIDHQFGSGRDSLVYASSGYGTNEYDATTSVDAFTLIFSQTAVAGVITVYGYNK